MRRFNCWLILLSLGLGAGLAAETHKKLTLEQRVSVLEVQAGLTQEFQHETQEIVQTLWAQTHDLNDRLSRFEASQQKAQR